MLQFARLRLAGFKSFLEPAEVQIAPGLTGIVGPNGCGKSNLLEALRWVMGESQARQLRGGDMDDVIFAGSATRPPRDIAEVTITFEPSPLKPAIVAHLSAEDEIEVTRRIERGRGSIYRLNGREVRARDVQLLFADIASGARSTAIVTQGQVAQLIAARPAERRVLLEEAAGIVGLHTRRQEASSRLNGVAENLQRVVDVRATLHTQHQQLARQARQAARYREIAAAIRRTEANLLAERWRRADQGYAQALAAERQLAATLTQATAEAEAAAAALSDAVAALGPLREAKAAAEADAARLQGLAEGLAAEQRRVEDERRAGRERLRQAISDRERQQAVLQDAEASLNRLAAERARLTAAIEREQPPIAEAAAALAATTSAIEGEEARLAELTARVATTEARRTSLERQQAELAAALLRLRRRQAEIAQQRAALAETLDRTAADADGGGDPETQLMAVEQRLAALRADLERATAERATAEAAADAAAGELRQAESAAARLQAEAGALRALLASAPDFSPDAAVNHLSIPDGLEAAVAAALGEGLLAAVSGSAARHAWQPLPPLADPPPLPAAVPALAELISGPDALARRLSQTGLVDDPAGGLALQPQLKPGQRLVSRDGGCWQWDGLTIAAGSPPAAAVRLQQQQRLRQADSELAAATARLDAARRQHDDARAAARAAACDERSAQTALREAEAGLQRMRQQLDAVRHARAQAQARAAASAEAAAAVEADLQELTRRQASLATEHAALPQSAPLNAALAEHRQALARLRQQQLEQRAACDGLEREAAGRRRRLASLAPEEASWTSRQRTALQQRDALAARQAAAEAELAALDALPEQLARRAHELKAAGDAASERQRAAAAALAAAEAREQAAAAALKQAEATLARCREEAVRRTAAVEQAAAQRTAVAEQIAVRLSLPPEALPQPDADAGAAPVDLAAEERQLERLKRERDQIGPVNLRAEDEAAALAQQIADIDAQVLDLEQAVQRLRAGLAELEGEGRERLRAAFEAVDRHFRQLFTRLFGGGQAHLTLTDGDDLLQSGLEIMASPPGKRLQSLSLLSGGEQALAALALRFALFLSRPAPVCVLDEVDAPLDDANVDRFCALLAELAEGGTRFLLVTHHRLTMARMDRLYGVTMAERGVSQLVSVDLSRPSQPQRRQA